MTAPALASVTLAASAADVWALVTDVRNHVRWIPLTRIDAAPALAVGDTFAAVSGPGAMNGMPGLVDRMVVERLDAPGDPASASAPAPASAARGVAVYRKLGPVLLGTAAVRVTPRGPASCTLAWREDVYLRGLPRWLTAPVLRVPTTLMLRHALGRIRAELEHH